MFIGDAGSTEFQRVLENFLNHHRSTVVELEAVALVRPLSADETRGLATARSFIAQHECLMVCGVPGEGADRGAVRVVRFFQRLMGVRVPVPSEGLTEGF